MSRRRTILFSDHIAGSQAFEEVDEEADKQRKTSEQQFNNSIRANQSRRSRAPNELRDLNQQATPAARQTHVSVTPSAPKPTNEQLACLYDNCIKLLNENKINQKNAFQLKLIDYLGDIVLNKEITGKDTNFQVVGCTIDAGTKIYAARVDALHQNTYQMLSGLGHNDENGNNSGLNSTMLNTTGNLNNQNVNNAGENDDEENENKKKEKQKKRRVKKSSQIIENLDQITTKLNDDTSGTCDDDLYFCRISTAVEHEAIEGLLMNKLKYNNDCLKLLINKDDIYFEANENEDEYHQTQRITNNDAHQMIDVKPLCEYAVKSDLINTKICDDLNKFRFIGWNLDSNDDITKMCETFQDDLEKDRFNASSNMIDAHERQFQQLQQQQQLDLLKQQENMINSNIGNANDLLADDEMDMDLGLDNHNNSSNGNLNVHDSIMHGIAVPPGAAGIDDIRSLKSISDLTQLLSSTNTQSDYSYFNFDKLKLHDLPKHLKMIAVRLTNIQQQTPIGVDGDRQQNQLNTNQQQLQMKDRRKKEAPTLDFTIGLDRCKFFKVTKKAIYLSDRTIEKRFDKTYNLESERELDYNSRQLLQPYCKTINAKLFTGEADLDNIDNLLMDNLNKHGLNQTVINANEHNNTNGDIGNHGDYDDDDPMGPLGTNFDIPNTIAPTQEFLTQNGHEFNFETQMPNALMNEDLMSNNLNGLNGGHPIVLDGDYLIKAPEQVNALNIEYSKTAKNIDAKKLKHTIWSLICTNSSVNDKENINQNGEDVNDTEKINSSTNNSTINCRLRDIYKKLRPPLISQRTFDDLSVSIVFQMLLFLANEHGLRLTNRDDGSDVYITSANDI